MPHKESAPGWMSVTEVISYGLPKVSFSKDGRPFWYMENWRGKVGNLQADYISEEGRRVGTEFHQKVEDWFNAEVNYEVDDRMLNNFIHKFVVPYDVKPILLEPEEPYKDEKLRLQGTLDAIIETNRGIAIADWKSSNSINPLTLGLQLAAYAHLSKEGIWQGVGVRVDKKSNKVDVYWYDDLAPYWLAFLDVLKVARLARYGLE